VNSYSRKMALDAYTAIERGTTNTDSFQIFISDAEGPISPFHDIPFLANPEKKTYNAVIEVPRWTNAKMEIDTKSPLNPIIQDTKKGKLRYVANSFPHHGYIWNYGAIPQTWENPNHTDESTACKGDNDPVDICEIGQRVAKRGDVLEVKALGVLAMIDDGETDWKVIVIDVNDPMADKLNDIGDVEKNMPGFLQATREWFRIYKMPDGKPENKFAFNGEFKDAEFSHKILEETHEFWKGLVGGSADTAGLCPKNVLVDGSKSQITRAQAADVFAGSSEPGVGPELDNSVDLWHYVHLK